MLHIIKFFFFWLRVTFFFLQHYFWQLKKESWRKKKMLSNFLSAVFLLFFILSMLMCCAICEAASAQDTAGTPDKKITLFEPTKTKFKNNSASAGGELYESFTSPALSYVGDVVVVFAQARNSDEKCDIVEGYFKIEGDKLTDKDTGTGTAEWKKRVTENDEDNKCAENPTTVVDKDNIYLFFKNPGETDINIKYQIIKADMFNEIEKKKGITWESSSKDLMDQLKSDAGEAKDITSISSGSSGIVVKGTFVVPVWYTKNADNFVSIITKKSGTDPQNWKFVSSKTPVEGKYPAVVGWGDKLIMMTTSKEWLHKVYISADMGLNWTEAVGSLSNMWGSTKEDSTPNECCGRNSFITVEIGNSEKENVMLFTKPVKNNGKYDLYLWMSDYQRVYDVGAIATGSEKNPSSALLYAENDKLFVAYDKWEEDKSTIYAAYLGAQLSDVKKVLDAWTNQKTFFSQFCYGTDLALTKEQCTDNNNKIPTNGLVGFLSGNYDNDNRWVDEFLCVNATVTIDGTKVSKVENGLKFSGAGAGAKWPVNEQGQSQRYYFSNRGFTLVATVKIDSDANKNSVLGIGFGGSSDGQKSIGVWCNEGKWSVSDGSTVKTGIAEKACVKEGIYHVALILDKNNKFNVYIGKGKKGILPENSIDVQQPLSITHFYFGAENNVGTSPAAGESHVAVTNVLLYNRPFEQDEIGKLEEDVKPVEEIKAPPQNVDTNTGSGSSDHQTPTPLPNHIGGEKKENDESPSPSRTEDGGVGGGVRVFSLLLPLLCVSAPLLHL